jgi:catechol 2,3-dioxygenase-like lactoylglutathione lyase family enzyme
MFSHITVGCRDLQKSTAFYDAVLSPLGLEQRHVSPDGGPLSACWIDPHRPLPMFYVYMPFNRAPATAGNGSMLAFLASSQDAVDEAHAAGLMMGGADEGSPGPRPHYGTGYYGAYLRDPDGNKIHIVYRGDLFESLPSDEMIRAAGQSHGAD